MLPRRVKDMIARCGQPCAEVTRLASESLDRELSVLERFRLRIHFLMCVWCERYLLQVRFIRDAIRRYPERLENQENPPPASLPPEARERIKHALTPPK